MQTPGPTYGPPQRRGLPGWAWAVIGCGLVAFLIGPIAILAAILFPVFAQAREKARAASCLSNIKQVNLSFQMYLQDYDENMVPYRYNVNAAVYGGPRFWWPKLLDPYTKSWAIYHCPSGPDPQG